MPSPAARSSYLLGALLAGLLLVLLAPADGAQAATIQVTTSADENNTNLSACSLREALVAANTNAAFGGCPAGDRTVPRRTRSPSRGGRTARPSS
ncbi:MAG: CSLREA domain-containing protein [Chloroflexota bacterium]